MVNYMSDKNKNTSTFQYPLQQSRLPGKWNYTQRLSCYGHNQENQLVDRHHVRSVPDHTAAMQVLGQEEFA
jgi:hypothetical protein